MAKRIGILVVAYNAASTLAKVLDRIPSEFRPQITKVLVGDDNSCDSTYLIGLGYQQITKDLPLEVIRHPSNLGYGGNQKAGYEWAIANDIDVVVLLHGDGQYAPELLPQIVEPLLRDEADAVFGSRMLDPGAARAGGMPLYKWLGNRVLTRFENAVAGTELSEWHSGYRAYSVDALRAIPFQRNSDGFNFDTQVIVQLLEAGKRITEIPIPTYYGDEVCYVNGLKYAKDISADVVRYRLHKMGFGSGALAFASAGYEMKEAEDSSHQQVLGWLASRPPGRVLDLGCADGAVDQQLRLQGHEVTGIDLVAHAGIKERVDHFVAADLDGGLPLEVSGPFDIVLAADVLEHVRHPERVLEQVHDVLAPGGVFLLSVPNFAHWYPRARVALGRFDYDRRGILDQDHLRFFTRASLERLLATHGWRIRRRAATGLPLEVVDRSGAGESPGGGRLRGMVGTLDRLAVAGRPTLFAYQFLYELTPGSPRVSPGSSPAHRRLKAAAQRPHQLTRAGRTKPEVVGRAP